MPRSLLTTYPGNAGRFDEMLAADGELRPAWRSFCAHLDAATPEQMRHRLDYVRRRILENGVTYNVYADPKGADRPWALDPLPLILAPDEWRELSAAIAQRARLLNALLGDLYGAQTLLRDGTLPPALVYGHNGYLWPCRGIRPPGDVWLHLYAADLARSPDGRWWVIADRTQAPSGAGYALENRLIVSRVFAEQFRDLRVQHLASFFAALQDSLARWAPQDGAAGREAPLVVLLTPGRYNETYFEHAYLARYLGFPLVEGQDLTVRGDRVFLKTLTGLRRVHAILRRLDDDYCDPLELRGDSALGVPGLLQAVRAGQVLVANALGSGLLESAALPGFLPGACRQLLGEELRLPSVATWWCGEPAALDFTLANLDRLVIKGAFPSQRGEPVFGNALDGAARAALVARLRARPQAYVAQELVAYSQAPAWSATREPALVPRGVGLRVYVAATPDGYVVMPGGLTRVSAEADARIISMQRGGSSKDTWVRSDAAVDTFSLLRHSIGKADLVRSGRKLSSRVVENLYWFGRYAERCDGTARLLRVGLARLVDADAEPALRSVFELCRALRRVPEGEAEEGGPALAPENAPTNPPAGAQGTEAASGAASPAAASSPVSPVPRPRIEALLLAAVYGAAEAGRPSAGLGGDIRRLLWSGAQVREHFSLDNWHALKRLQLRLERYGEAAPTAEVADALAFLDRELLASSSLAGFALDNMTRDDGWRFLMIGRRIERLCFLADAVGQFLRLASTRAAGGVEWLLELTDSIVTYRARYMAQPELLPALDLIVFDDGNPHAVTFQMHILLRYLGSLSGEAGTFAEGAQSGEHREPTELPRDEPLAALLERLQAFDLARFEGLDFGACRDCGPCFELAALLGEIAAAAGALSDRLAMRYFTHVEDAGQQTLLA
ncbi:MAG: molybdopterin oxidoreductase [Candidatus Accumulibacter sp.]|nr:molybdopterin oxidoreductase [Accumulibacter sp.]MBA4092532.1 molybdopterin oxidoreductase [Accumulibacter sp.]